VTRGVNFEQEAGLTRTRVGDPVGAPSPDLQSVARSEHSVLASGSEPDRAGQDLEALVLTEMEMAGDEAAGFEANLGSQ
jgi:hypothetical protein